MLELSGVLRVEETEIHLLKVIENGYHTIELYNKKGEVINGNIIAQYLYQVRGIDEIQGLHISYSSELVDLDIIKAIPNLSRITVYGHSIKTLKGLENFNKGLYIQISTDNKIRSIMNIAQTSITALTLLYKKEEDFDAVSKCKTLKNLHIGSSPAPDFAKWSELPLESLNLSSGKFQELKDTALVNKLKKLTLINCRKLERFAGDNSNITWMLIDSCKKLDLSTIKTFCNLNFVCINTNPNEVSLSEFKGMEELKHLSFLNCKVYVDIMDLKEFMPSLEKLYISNINKELLQQLIHNNPGVSFKFS